MIKAAVFDLDNTLYDYDDAHAAAFSALCGYAARELDMSREEFARMHADTLRELAAEMGEVAATHNRMIRYQRILEKRGLPLSPHLVRMTSAYWDTFLSAAVPYESAAPLLALLRERGVRTGVCTNMTHRMQVLKMEKMGFLPLVDFVVSSEEAGCEKPLAGIFGLSIRKAGCAPDECLFIGDSPKHDIAGALAAGMRAACLVMPGKRAAGVGETGVPVITDLMQAADLIFDPGDK